MSFLVTGCGRSGSMFTARLFNELGVRTSHEEFFTAYTPLSTVGTFKAWLRQTSTIGEVSGLAGAYVACDLGHIARAHLVRNPVAVIASLVGLQDLHPQSHNLANIKYNFRHIPQMSRDDSPVVLAMKYWLYWNRRVRVAGHKAYRVEQISDGQGEYAIQMLRDLGVEMGRNECQDALVKLGKRYNGGRRDVKISWRTLPGAAGLKDGIAAEAMAYGYTMADLETYCVLGDNCPHCGLEGS